MAAGITLAVLPKPQRIQGTEAGAKRPGKQGAADIQNAVTLPVALHQRMEQAAIARQVKAQVAILGML